VSQLALGIDGLRAGYGEAVVLRDVTFGIEPGEIFTVLGKNGMGKSTLLKTLMGFLPVKAGRVAAFGRDITGLPPHRVARRAIAYTPQEQSLFQDLTVRENLQLGLADQRRFEESLRRVGGFFPFLPQRLGQRAGTLSGGEQKMLLISRALMARPRLMLIDEISEGLQPSVVERLVAVLKAEREASQVSILLIEQNIAFALAVADRYAVLQLGEIVDRGTVDGAGTADRIVTRLSV
jgi:ABC-type branched-subunit amino acid transport system ATPase component